MGVSAPSLHTESTDSMNSLVYMCTNRAMLGWKDMCTPSILGVDLTWNDPHVLQDIEGWIFKSSNYKYMKELHRKLAPQGSHLHLYLHPLIVGQQSDVGESGGIFTNSPSSLPRARPDLTAEFSPDLLTDITSHMEGYGTIRSGEYIL